MRKSLRTRILITFIALATGPLVLAGILLAWQNFNGQEQNSLAAQDQEAVNVSTQITAFISALERELRIIIQTHDIEALSYDEQQNLLNQLLTYQKDFEELALLDSKGQEQVR